MKTVLSRLKTLMLDNMVAGATLSYVKHTEVVHPELGLTMISMATLPAVLIVPIGMSEAWIASQKKEAINTVNAYLVLSYNQRESSIMGDPSRPDGHGKGIMDFANDFLSVVRGHFLGTGDVDYLSKPLDVVNIDYFADTLGENAHVLVAQFLLEARRQFLQTSLPVNV